jgi:hypothetical protein
VSAARLALVAVLAIATGCTDAQLRRVNYAGAALTVASMAADWCQTRSAAAERWSGGRAETGAMAMRTIGDTPSSARVDAYFAITTVAMVGLAQLVPAKYRPAAYAAVTAVEVNTVAGNLGTTNCAGVGR